MKREVREILVGMKAELSQGWVQGDLITDKGVCLYGAFAKAARLEVQPICGGGHVQGRNASGPGYIFYHWTPAGRAINALAAETGETWETLALWNDAPERTASDITDAIDRILTRGHGLKKNARKRKKRKAALVPA